jgi:hypothetical protein
MTLVRAVLIVVALMVGFLVFSNVSRKADDSRAKVQPNAVWTHFLKGEVKRKHRGEGWSLSCFAAHLNERGLF